MKRVCLFVAIGAFVLVGVCTVLVIATGAETAQDSSTVESQPTEVPSQLQPTATHEPTAIPSPTSTPNPTATPLPTSTPDPTATAVPEFLVSRIVDGDTIDVRLPDGEVERVRLLLVDTPEVYGGVECFGREASQYVANLLPVGSSVKLERDKTNRDGFGRLLRYVFLSDGTMLNERLVEDGYAEYFPYNNVDIQYAERIEAAQHRAQAGSAGLWTACAQPVVSPEPTPDDASGEDCDPNYQGLCIPIGSPDLNCPEIREMLREQGLQSLRVVGNDPHRLDRDGDGIACEL